MKKKIFFVNGSLGSGKTTLINQLLENDNFKNSFIIENEIANFSIDHNCFPVDPKNIKVLAGQCVCCSNPAQLSNLLKELKDKNFDKIIIESSGVASLNELLIKVLSDQSLENLYEIGACIFVVDALGIERTNTNDLEIADFVVITKYDALNNFSQNQKIDSFIKNDFAHIQFQVKDNINDKNWINKLLLQTVKTFREWSLLVNDSHYHGDNFVEVVKTDLDKINWEDKSKKMNDFKIDRVKGFFKKDNQLFHIEATPEQFKIEISDKKDIPEGVVVIGKNKILLNEFISL